MSSLRSICFAFFNLTLLVASAGISEYLNTRVIVENPECATGHSPPPMSTNSSRSPLECSSFCTSVEECRRFLFIPRTNSCVLFGYGEHCYVESHDDVVGSQCFRQMYTCGKENCSRCPIGYYGDRCESIIRNCHEGGEKGVVPSVSLMAFIRPSPSLPAIEVKCNFDQRVTTIMQRNSNCNEVDFDRGWKDYVDGFGSAYGEFWIGLEYLHHLMINLPVNKLTVRVTTQTSLFISYYQLNISDVSSNYTISIGGFKSSLKKLTDDMLTTSGSTINGRPFSTYDRDYTSYGCPYRFKGGWWYLDDQVCSLVNLNGRRESEVAGEKWFWASYNQSNIELKRIHMKV